MLRKWFIHKLGGYTEQGFPDVQTAIEYLRETDGEEKYEVLRWAVQELFLAPSEDDILKLLPNGEWQYLGKPMSKDGLVRLKKEAQILRKLSLWEVLKTDVRYQLSRKMYEEGRIKEDFVWGQLATYLFDVIETRLKRLDTLK